MTGEDFFGREKELGHAHRYLNENQSLLLSAPRRIGKSSMAKRLINDKTEAGWKCVYVDLQGIATKDAFLRKLIGALTGAGLLEKSSGKLKDFAEGLLNSLSGVSIAGVNVDLTNRAQTESLFNRLSGLFNHDENTLIVVDELPLFLGHLMDKEGENRDDVEFMLNWLRSIRQYEDSNIRWLFCGSVGLRNFTNHYKMSQTINDLVDFKLGELPENEAKGLLSALAQAYKLRMSDSVVAETLSLLQWPIPYFIQLLIDRLISNIDNPEEKEVGMEDVRRAIDELSESDYFLTWDERLYEYRDLEGRTRRILDNLAKAKTGLSVDQLQTIVMAGQDPNNADAIRRDLIKIIGMLEHDGYILKGETIKFRSPLLRKWWKTQFML